MIMLTSLLLQFLQESTLHIESRMANQFIPASQDGPGLKTESLVPQEPPQSQANKDSWSPSHWGGSTCSVWEEEQVLLLASPPPIL